VIAMSEASPACVPLSPTRAVTMRPPTSATLTLDARPTRSL
jgi:hypothetical protein